MIRHATPADIPELAAMGKAFHEKSGLTEFEYVEADCASSLANLMQLPGFVCLVNEGERIDAAIGGIICPVYFNLSHVSGEELFWWSEGLAGVRLLDALEKEVAQRGCHSWQMKSIDRLNGAAMAQLYHRRGYIALENSYIKRL